STACARPVSSRTTRNCMRFWSRRACTQPRTVTRSPTLPPSSSIAVRFTALLRRPARKLDSHRELRGLLGVQAVDRSRLHEVVLPQLQRSYAIGTVAHEN